MFVAVSDARNSLIVVGRKLFGEWGSNEQMILTMLNQLKNL